MMSKIVLVGAGNIGSRHLQALALLERDADIQVIDPYQPSLDLSKKRFEEVSERTHEFHVSYELDIANAWKDADLAIVATSSGPRRKIVEQLVSATNIKRMLLEKVLFQSVRDLYEVEELFRLKGIQAWVDCGRRNSSFYQHLHDELAGESMVNMIVDDGEWGLGCNSLHMLDLYAFVCGGGDIPSRYLAPRLGYSGKQEKRLHRVYWRTFTGLWQGAADIASKPWQQDARIQANRKRALLLLSG